MNKALEIFFTVLIFSIGLILYFSIFLFIGWVATSMVMMDTGFFFSPDGINMRLISVCTGVVIHMVIGIK